MFRTLKPDRVISDRPAHRNLRLAVRCALFVALVIACSAACSDSADWIHSNGSKDEPPMTSERIRSLLDSDPRLSAIAGRADEFRLQVVIGEVDQSDPDHPRLVQETFRADAEYFYPASTVKLFAAIAALERLDQLREETGLPLQADTPLVFHPLFDDEVLEQTDESNLDGGAITIAHEIRKLFLVSDNQAFNRLYEFVGQDRLAASLARAGLGSPDAGGPRIVHRLSESRSVEDNRHSPRIDFVADDFDHTLPQRRAEPMAEVGQRDEALPGLRVGQGFLTADGLVEGPMDFSSKNRISLVDLQRGLCLVVRPDVDCRGGATNSAEVRGFELSGGDRELLVEAMSQLPRESANPIYDPAEVPDDYVKFLLPGLRQALPGHDLRIYNKIGQAYGFSTENAMIWNETTDRSIFVAATLYTNANGVLNDDTYEYDTVTAPFFAALGEAVARTYLADPAPDPR